MGEDKDFELKQFLVISQKMLDYAENNDWEKLPDLESDRKKIMQSLFESQDSDSHSSSGTIKIEQTIKNVLSINEKIEQLAQQEKVVIGQQLQGLKKKQNVHSAYLQNK
ncbi:MAG: hypothetical protein GQ546_02345 [Gammaproteobacteria bacterium]|nr:hypothetical protein [Gammaproteobacteria bacterium]